MKNCNILIMEDDDDLRHLYTKALTKYGYQVYPAGTIQIARDLLTQHQFDAFLCDIRMDYKQLGTDLLQEQLVKLNQDGTHIIILSCEAQYRPMCEEMGIEFFMEKPVSIQAIVTLVDRLTVRHAS